MALSYTLVLSIWIILILVLIVIFIVYAVLSAKPEPADRIFYNGSIISMQGQDQIYEAIAIRDNLIVSIGTQKEVYRFEGDQTILTNLEGKALLPGFIDCGSNFPFNSLYSDFLVDLSPNVFIPNIYPPNLIQSQDLEGVNNLEDILRKLQRAVDTSSPGEWVVGSGYDPNFLPEGQELNRDILDTLGSLNPIWVLYRTEHSGVANSVTLDMVNIFDSPVTSNPPGGRIIRNADGRATGLLQMSAAGIVNQIIPLPSIRDNFETSIIGSRVYSSQGVTTVLNMRSNQITMQFLNSLSRLDTINNRIILYPTVDTSERILSGIFQPKVNPGKVKVGATFLIADGDIQYYTAYLEQPYLIPPSYNPNPNYSGFFGNQTGRFKSLFYEFNQSGQQIAVNVNGQAAIQFVIETIAESQLLFPRPDARHILIGCQNITLEQLKIIKDLPIVLSFFSPSIYYWGDFYRDQYLGLSRTQGINPIKSAIDLDIPYTINTLAPTTPINILQLIWTAVNRQSLTGQIYGISEQISTYQALEAVTINAAYSHFTDGETGSLTTGKFADLVIISEDPLKIDPKDLNRIKVSETIVNGKTVYQS